MFCLPYSLLTVLHSITVVLLFFFQLVIFTHLPTDRDDSSQQTNLIAQQHDRQDTIEATDESVVNHEIDQLHKIVKGELLYYISYISQPPEFSNLPWNLCILKI